MQINNSVEDSILSRTFTATTPMLLNMVKIPTIKSVLSDYSP